MAEFQQYQHIEKLGTSSTQGILDGKVYVFPKIDGTNASIWCDSNGVIQYGSRKKHLRDSDNHKFKATMSSDPESQEVLRRIFQMLGDVTLYGEWLVPHTLKTYRTDAWDNFYLFDIWDNVEQRYVPFYDWGFATLENSETTRVSVVPPLFVGDGYRIPGLLGNLLQANQYLCTEGIGEGIVIKNYDYMNPYGDAVWAKVVAQDFAAKRKQVHAAKGDKPKSELEQKLVDRFLDGSLIEKEWLSCGGGVFEPQRYPELFGRVWKTFLEEETYEMVKWCKNGTINFRSLHMAMVDAVKRHVSEGGLG